MAFSGRWGIGGRLVAVVGEDGSGLVMGEGEVDGALAGGVPAGVPAQMIRRRHTRATRRGITRGGPASGRGSWVVPGRRTLLRRGGGGITEGTGWVGGRGGTGTGIGMMGGGGWEG